MNKYLISIIEVIVFVVVARFISKNILLFTGDESLVNLNYIFWGILLVLSILVNFHLYIYFGSVLILGIFFMAIYIHKIVKVITFVEKDYNMFFWMLFGTLFIPIIVLILTKRILYSAADSDAPQGYKGIVGSVGQLGNNFFIESVGDRAYVVIVNEIELYLREIMDKNEIDYDTNTHQFNNYYLKDNLKRICNSQEFINRIWNKAKVDRSDTQLCAHFDSIRDSRFCTEYTVNDNGVVGIPTQPINTVPCNSNRDCNDSNAESIIKENDRLSDLLKLTPENESNDLLMLLLRVKYWIRLILENNCEQDKKLRSKLKIQDIYKLSDIKMGFVDSFQEFQENAALSELEKHTYLDINSVNHYRLNNLLGRKFIQSNFQNHKYWQKNNIKTINRNPFDIIHLDPVWNWGNPDHTCVTTSTIGGPCSVKPHAM